MVKKRGAIMSVKA